MPTYHLSRRFGKGCPAERLRASGVPFVPVEREDSRGRLRLRASSAVLVTPGGALTAGWQQMEQVETHGNGAASAGGSDT